MVKKIKQRVVLKKHNVPANPKPAKIPDNPPLGEEINKPAIGIKGSIDNPNKTVERLADSLIREVPHLDILDLIEPSNLGNSEKIKMYQAPMQDPRDFILHEPGSKPEDPEETSFLNKSKSFLGWASQKALTATKNAAKKAGDYLWRGTKKVAKMGGRVAGLHAMRGSANFLDYVEGDPCAYCEERCGISIKRIGKDLGLSTLKQIAEDSEKSIK